MDDGEHPDSFALHDAIRGGCAHGYLTQRSAAYHCNEGGKRVGIWMSSESLVLRLGRRVLSKSRGGQSQTSSKCAE